MQPRIAEVARRVARGVVALELKQGPVASSCPGLARSHRHARAVRSAAVQLDAFAVRRRSRASAWSAWATPSRSSPGQLPRGRAARISLTAQRRRGTRRSGRSPPTGAAPRRHATQSRCAATATASCPSRPRAARLRAEITLRVELGWRTLRARARCVGGGAQQRAPNVGLSHPLLLSGNGWRLEQKPPESRAQLRAGRERASSSARIYRVSTACETKPAARCRCTVAATIKPRSIAGAATVTPRSPRAPPTAP